uniref:Putative secreted protein n=1 Tax=Anopheles triannulatus TaxID=58253 RepID=A0A2M4B0Z1_9DIPT
MSSSSVFTACGSVVVAAGEAGVADGCCCDGSPGACGALSEVRGSPRACSCFLSSSRVFTSGCQTERSAPLDLILRTLAACSSTAFWASFKLFGALFAEAADLGAALSDCCCCCWPPYFCFSSASRESSILENSTAGFPIRCPLGSTVLSSGLSALI